jgi:ribose 5-phosphate isomerase B
MQTSNNFRIAIASDHAGFTLKESIKKFLNELGYEVEDFGTDGEESADYPDFAVKVADAVKDKEFERGILICGTGIGMSIAANKVPEVRAAMCYNIETAKLSREHNNANVLTLGARMIGEEEAKKIIDVWLKTKFLGERHLGRVEKIDEIDKKYRR